MGLDFALQAEATGWNAASDRALATGLSLYGWGALFLEVLGCPEFADGEDVHAWECYRTQFRQAIPEYPMLARISDYYDDVWYDREEIRQLRRECEQVQGLTTNANALIAINSLIEACDEASRSGLGLSLAAD